MNAEPGTDLESNREAPARGAQTHGEAGSSLGSARDIAWRLGATAIHAAITAALLLGLAAVIRHEWYPGFLFELDGGRHGLAFLVAVGLVLGPVLTLVAYRPGKPGLVKDMAVIVTLQLLALGAGAWTVRAERPLALVFAGAHFFTMDRDAWLDAGVPVPDLARLPGDWPKRIAVELPPIPHEATALRARLYRMGQPLRTYAERYVPLDEGRAQILAAGVAEPALRERDRAALRSWLAGHDGDYEDFAFVPFGARFGYRFLAVRRSDAEIVDVVPIPVRPRT